MSDSNLSTNQNLDDEDDDDFVFLPSYFDAVRRESLANEIEDDESDIENNQDIKITIDADNILNGNNDYDNSNKSNKEKKRTK